MGGGALTALFTWHFMKKVRLNRSIYGEVFIHKMYSVSISAVFCQQVCSADTETEVNVWRFFSFSPQFPLSLSSLLLKVFLCTQIHLRSCQKPNTIGWVEVGKREMLKWNETSLMHSDDLRFSLLKLQKGIRTISGFTCVTFVSWLRTRWLWPVNVELSLKWSE